MLRSAKTSTSTCGSGSQLALPHNRETLLHFFERVQKAYPGMTRFRKNDNNEFNLEEDRSSQRTAGSASSPSASPPAT